MNFLIYSPALRGSTRGNRITAVRWRKVLVDLNHSARITAKFDPTDSRHHADCLIGLHAFWSNETIESFHARFPDRPICLCLTGTDIHLDMKGKRGATNRAKAIRSMELATFIILLEPECARHLPTRLREKTRVILQSATPFPDPPQPNKNLFEVTVLAHLRPIKDPLRTALAARKLPKKSKIMVRHLGGTYTSADANAAVAETKSNPRYQWLGDRPYHSAQRALARSRLTVLTSLAEGAPSLFAEAVVNRVPILATRIDASIGMLGGNYPGLFPVGDTNALAKLMFRAETDVAFYRELKRATKKLEKKFAFNAERQQWKKVIREVSAK